MDRACAALSDAAAELGARRADHVAEDPEQRHVGWDIDGAFLIVDRDIHRIPAMEDHRYFHAGKDKLSFEFQRCRQQSWSVFPASINIRVPIVESQ
jgi:hypothetical protein